MLAIQHLLVFSMLYLVLIRFLNFEYKRGVKQLNLIVFSVLFLIDVFRQIHYGHQLVHSYDPLLGLICIFIVSLYMLDGFKSWVAWLATSLSLFVCFFINNISTGFLFGLLEIDIALMQSYGWYNVLSLSSGLLLLLFLYQMSEALGLKINIFSLTKEDALLILIFMILFGFYIGSTYQRGLNSTGFRSLMINTFTLLSGVVSAYLVLYLATQKTVIKDI